jgi:hypothetical protein
MYKFPFIIALFLLSCSNSYIEEAQKLEVQGKYLEAIDYYKKYANSVNDKEKAFDSLSKAAKLYRQLYLCERASEIYETMSKNYGDNPKMEEARQDNFICPDYKPSKNLRKIVYGDSQSLGKNAREVISFSKSDDKKSSGTYVLYAGKRILDRGNISYYYQNFDLIFLKKNEKRILVQYPLKKDRQWQDNKKKYYIIGYGMEIETKAGKFKGCVAVAEKNNDIDFRQVSYYAPNIGRVLTTIESKSKKNRIMEIISYE